MRILYATDGSEGAKAGAAFLRNLSLTPADTIALLTVVQSEEGKAEAHPIFENALAGIGPTEAAIHRYIRHGNAAEEIIDSIVWMAEEVPTDLVVVGATGRTGLARFFLGSVAERVARFATCPVLTANHIKGALRQIVIGYDGSRSARRSVTFVDKLPLSPDCEVCLATMVTPAEATGFLPGSLRKEIDALRREEVSKAKHGLEEMAKLLTASGRNVVTALRETDPASGLLDLADERKADLLVVGAHGMSEVEQFMLGSVSDKVMRHAPCSVLVVRPYLGLE